MKSLRKIFHPELFQGSLRRSNYFEGWYFKHVSEDRKNAFAVIPGISLSEDRHAFVQFIDGNNGRTFYFRYPVSEFHSDNREFKVTVGSSVFSYNGIDLNLANEKEKIEGKITYSGIAKLKSTIMQPGIMGWYSYVPTMECNHGVVSANHTLDGFLEVNNEKFLFNNGKGYIEKDWGTSFPESWIWLQCNSFDRSETSVMISVAKIPWKGHYFMGFISFVYAGGKQFVLASYNSAKIKSLKKTDSGSHITVQKGELTLDALITARGAGFLKAPSNGLMINNIPESISSAVWLRLTENKEVIFEGSSERAGYEETPHIFTYF